MVKLLLKHFVQFLFIPSAGVTIGWYGHIGTDIQPHWSLLDWALVTFAIVVLIELMIFRVGNAITLLLVFFSTAIITLGIPAYFFAVGFPVKVHGVLDHGGLLLGLALIAAFSTRWRVYKAGYTALDVIEASGNLPKGPLSRLLENSDATTTDR
ncbi:MAG: hypothetical protein NXH95_14275 [Pseudomonadaceae bacterium]|nr:hypothetical protein [Pseudomonadaceae bacterium]